MTYNWRITFPIEKAETRDDGLYITGLASGPEIDSTGERMTDALIYRYADQINATGSLPLEARLPYRDAHAPDGVLRDLGWVTRAWVDDNSRLAVEVRLDHDNPAAAFLFRAIQRGKQYGMSVAGKVLDYVDEYVAEVGAVVRTYKDVVLTEISNTTRPAWTPSFGTVLSKAINDAAGAESLQGVTPVENEELTQEQAESAEASAVETEKASEETAEEVVETTEATTESDTEKADDEAEAPAEDVEKAGRRVSSATATRLLGIYNEWGAALRDLGLLEDTTENNEPAEKADSDDEGDTLTKSDEQTVDVTALLARVEELAKSNSELTAKVAELEQRPLTQVPPVVERADADVEDFKKSFESLDPAAKLRVAFAAATGGK